MNECAFNDDQQWLWKEDDPRLLRAARRIIRLYDLEQEGIVCVKAESLASLIAHELNRPPGQTSR